MLDRRKSKRLEITIPLKVRLLDISKKHPAIETKTKNISPLGISMELQVILTHGVFYQAGETLINLIPYLVLENKEVALEMTLPPDEDKIIIRGKIVWYDFALRESLHYFIAGVLLDRMEPEDKTKWERFMREVGLAKRALWQYIQLLGAATFFAGVFIFIAGFWKTLAPTAKIGIFLSLIGLMSFIFSWWRHRSFMLLRHVKTS